MWVKPFRIMGQLSSSVGVSSMYACPFPCCLFPPNFPAPNNYTSAPLSVLSCFQVVHQHRILLFLSFLLIASRFLLWSWCHHSQTQPHREFSNFSGFLACFVVQWDGRYLLDRTRVSIHIALLVPLPSLCPSLLHWSVDIG